MRKMLTIVRREYLSRLKTKGFVIGTVLTPVLLLSFRLVPEWLMAREPDQPKRIAVIDQTHEILEALRANVNDKNENGDLLYTFFNYEAPPEELEKAKNALSEQVAQGALDGYIIIPSSVYEDGKVEYFSKSVTNFRDNGRIRSGLSHVVTESRIQKSGMHSEQVRQLVQRVPLRTVRTSGGKEQEESGQTEKLVWLMVMLIYMAMIIYGQIVMRSVIEEKSSRVIESVISSIKPFHLMAGKILGIGALGLTQYAIWALVLGLLPHMGGLFAGKNAMGMLATLPALPLQSLAFFIVFFVLGYFLFATMYAAVGAMVNSEQEAQQLVFPVVMLVIIPLLFTLYIISNPNSRMAVVLSLIPFFAPLTMFARVVVLTPPAWQIALSIVLLIATILAMIWLVGRIYRVGVLMYGKRPTLPELLKWIKYA